MADQISQNNENTVNKAPRKKGLSKKGLFYALFIALCVGSIAVTAFLDFGTDKKTVPFSLVAQTLSENYRFVICAVLCFFAVLVFKGIKRAILLNACLKGGDKFWLGFKSAVICKHYDCITPLGSGGQPMEILYLKRHGVPTSVASGVAVTSYAIGLLSSVFLSIVMIIICGFDQVNTIAIILAIIGIVLNIVMPAGILLFSASPKAGDFIARKITGFGSKLKLIKNRERFEKRAINTMKDYGESIRYFFGTYFFKTLIATLFGVMYNVALYSVPYFIIRAFGVGAQEISYFKVLELCLICYLAITAIPTPGNSGAAEISFYAIFSSFLQGGMLFWGVVIWRVLTYYMFIVTGLIFITFGRIFRKKEYEDMKLGIDVAELRKRSQDHRKDYATNLNELKATKGIRIDAELSSWRKYRIPKNKIKSSGDADKELK